jgi:hypothetical protein
MDTEAQTTGHRDALIAAGALLALGILWIFLKLFWQGALLVVIAAAVAYLGYYRLRDAAEKEPEPPAKPKAEPAGPRPKSKKKKKPKKKKAGKRDGRAAGDRDKGESSDG